MSDYIFEQADRQGYVDRTRSHLLEILRRERTGLTRAMGEQALRLLVRQTAGFFIPEITADGEASVPRNFKLSDATGVMALNRTELVQRHESFAHFTPWQHKKTPMTYLPYLRTVADRVKAGPKEAFVAQTFGQEASVMRMIYRVEKFRSPDQTTYFNMRPLILLDYDPDEPHGSVGSLANAITMAHEVCQNPVLIVQDEGEFDYFNEQWKKTGEKIGRIITSHAQNG